MLTDLNPPPAEPVALAEAKAFLRLDHDEEDQLIETLILSARERLEAYLNIAMIKRPMRIALPAGGTIKLPRWPVVSVDKITANGETINDATIDLRCRPAQVTVCIGEPVEIDFTAGYGLDPADIPAPLRQAMLLLIAQGFENRGDAPSSMPLMVDALTMPYRVVGL